MKKTLFLMLNISLFLVSYSNNNDTELKMLRESFSINLDNSNSIPMVMDRTETGTAYIRLVGAKMFYKVIINDLDPTDAIAASHIHNGASTANGGVLLNLDMTNTAQLNSTKSLTLSAENQTKVTNDALYVNIHSTKVASVLLRSQIR
jgi:hypothetical protein